MSQTSKKQMFGMLKVAAVMLVVSLGVWGCARKPAEANSDRIRALEARCVKLEQDYRTVAQARDKARRDLAALEADGSVAGERDQLRKEVEAITADRDRLTKQLSDRTTERDQLGRDLNSRTAERDTALTRYDRLRKSLQTIVTQDESGPQQNTTAPLSGAISN